MSATKMTGKQRYKCTFSHQEPDCVPIFEQPFSRAFFQHVLGYRPDAMDPVSAAKMARAMGYDVVGVNMGGMAGFREKGTSDIYKDEWGITYKTHPDAWPIDGTIAHPLADGDDWKKFTFPDPALPERYKAVEEAVRLASEDGTAIVGNVRGMFTGTWMLFGMENFSYMLYDEPEIIDEILTKYTDFALYGARKMIELGVDGIMMADDYGSNTQPMISKEHFDRHIAPQLKRFCDEVHKAGSVVTLHSDGCIRPLLDTIVSCGIDALHPIQRRANMDIAEIKATYGDKITLIGNIDNSFLLVEGTPEEVADQVKECLRVAAPGGGYILSSDHSIHDDVPPANVYAIYETGRKFGTYPIQL